MDLPVMPTIKPMLAKATKSMPPQSAHPAGFLYEPKWDGFGAASRRVGVLTAVRFAITDPRS